MPKVSVLLPIYNNAQYLDECFESLRSQTLSDFEAVCINDGSTDGSLDIMKAYAAKDERFTVVDKPNTGYGNSLNVGCSKATGDYVTVLESDDVFPSDALEAMYEFAVSQDLDFLKADAENFWSEGEGRRFEYVPASENPLCYEAVFDSSADPGRYFARGGQPGLYKRSFLIDNDIKYHDSPGATFQDTSYWAQVMFCGRRVCFLAKSCYLIRRDNPGSSVKVKDKIYFVNDEYDFVRTRIDELPNINRDACKVACAYFRFRNCRWDIDRIDASLRRLYIWRFSEDFRAIDAAGELDRSYFAPDELAVLETILTDPDRYYYENWYFKQTVEGLMRRVEDLENENRSLRGGLDELYSSVRYRVGSAVASPVDLVRKARS